MNKFKIQDDANHTFQRAALTAGASWYSAQGLQPQWGPYLFLELRSNDRWTLAYSKRDYFERQPIPNLSFAEAMALIAPNMTHPNQPNKEQIMEFTHIVAYAGSPGSSPTVLKLCKSEQEASEHAAQQFAANRGAYHYGIYELVQHAAPAVPQPTFVNLRAKKPGRKPKAKK